MKIVTFAAQLLASGVLALGLQPSAQASPIVIPHSYNFTANCTDCAAAANTETYQVTGTLNTRESGNGIDLLHSFSYGGSNLVDPYTVSFAGPSDYFYSNLSSITGFHGGGVDANWSITLLFGDGLFFVGDSSGAWSTCARSNHLESSRSTSAVCDGPTNPYFFQTDDIGDKMAFATVPTDNNVPEPGSLALLGSGLALIWVARRRREQQR